MTWLELIPDAIPVELRTLGWVLWRAEQRGAGKPTKVPYCVAEPSRRASSTDPSTWATFADAVEARSVVDAAGIGVVLTAGAGITCIDLDRVIASDGSLDTRAATIVERCDSWTEISPSGTGAHVFVRGSAPRALRGLQIEVYSWARYIAVTGHRWPGTPARLTNQQAYLDYLTALERQDAAPRLPWAGRSAAPPDDLAGALLAKLEAWGIRASRLKRWQGGFLVELECPWASEHTTGSDGGAVIIHPSGAFDYTCLHSHCASRDWRDFRAVMERRA